MSPTIEMKSPLYSSLGADPDLGEIVEMFVDEMPDRVGTLREQWEARNWEELQRIAHQIKGAAGSYGFDQITPYAADFEDAIRGVTDPDEECEQQLLTKLEELMSWCSSVQAGAPQ